MKEAASAKKATAMTSDPEIMEVRWKVDECWWLISGSFWQVTEEEAKKIEKESKKEEQAPSAADPTAVPTSIAAGGADAERKDEETPATASETKKVTSLW